MKNQNIITNALGAVDLFGRRIEPLREGQLKNKTILGGALTVFMILGVLYSGNDKV